MEFKEYKGKNVDEAITNACIDLGIEAAKLEYEVIEKGSNGFLGIGSKPAIIKAKKNQSVEDIAREFLNKVFTAMELTVKIDIKIVENEKENVFTFTYKPGETGEIIENTNVVTTVISTTPSTNANQGNNGTGNATGGTQNNDGDTTTAGDEDVPQGLVDLDDEDTPKSNISVNNEKNSSTPIYAGIAISLAAIVGIIVAFMTIRKKRV